MIPRIRTIKAMPKYKLLVEFDGGEKVLYDVQDDIRTLKDFEPLETEHGLFESFQIDESRTCVFWSDRIDLPSDKLFEYGMKA